MVKSVILAAGKGTRMKSDKPKVVHQVMGKPMVYYSIEAARQAGADEVCVNQTKTLLYIVSTFKK